jgi:hypothetical protein
VEGDIYIVGALPDRDSNRSEVMTVIRTITFSSWPELVKESLRLSALGYICEVRGWDDMSANRLTISTED